MKKIYLIIFIFTSLCLEAQITNTPLAGKPLNDFPWFQCINNFQTDDTVYLAIDPNRFPNLINQTISVFIVESRTPDSYAINPFLEDVRGAAQEVIISGINIQENIFTLDQSSLLEDFSGASLGVGYDLRVHFQVIARLKKWQFAYWPVITLAWNIFRKFWHPKD